MSKQTELQGEGSVQLVPQGPGHSSVGVRINLKDHFKGAILEAALYTAGIDDGGVPENAAVPLDASLLRFVSRLVALRRGTRNLVKQASYWEPVDSSQGEIGRCGAVGIPHLAKPARCGAPMVPWRGQGLSSGRTRPDRRKISLPLDSSGEIGIQLCWTHDWTDDKMGGGRTSDLRCVGACGLQ